MLAAGCSTADDDEDGLSNAEEAELGSDPLSADTDGDGLSDLDEFDLGTDLLSTDTDGDGYPDGAEVDVGSDPSDSSSGLYAGGWPYNPNKDELTGRESDTIEVGKRIPRLVLKDQHGDDVDLYDFAGHDKMIIIDLSAFNCGPCISTATWMADPSTWQDLENELGTLREGINDEEVYWLTFAYTSYYPPSESSKSIAKDWANSFPNEAVPVFSDKQLEMWDFAYQGGMPFFALLNDKMIVKSFDMGIGGGVPPLADAQASVE